MSQYMEIYIRKDNDFILIHESCCTADLYQFLNDDIPYGKIKRLDEQVLNNAIERAEKQLQETKETRKIIKKSLKGTIKNGNLQDSENLRTRIKDSDMDIDFIRYAYYVLYFMKNMLEDKVLLYAGIETCDPTIDDIDI